MSINIEASLFHGSLADLLSYLQSYRQKWLKWKAKTLIDLLLSLEDSEVQKLHESSADINKMIDDIKSGKLYDLIGALDTANRFGVVSDYGYGVPSDRSFVGRSFRNHADISVLPMGDSLVVQPFLSSEFTFTPPPKFNGARFSDFHYQDRADPYYEFEDLSPTRLEEAEKEYEARGVFWKDILSKYNYPEEYSFNYSIGNCYNDRLKVAQLIGKKLSVSKNEL